MKHDVIESKINSMLENMTIDEKIGQLDLSPAGWWRVDEVRELVRKGLLGNRILATTALAGNETQMVSEIEENDIVAKIAMEETRLSIPVMNGRDIIHGQKTVYPIPLATAASFNTELVKTCAAMAAKEASCKGVHWAFSPALDIARDPRWGRIAEGYGEDPFLASRMAVAMVKGMQGDDLSDPYKVAACAKHFVGYGAAEGGRDYNTAEITEYTLHNVYLPPFKAAVKAGLSSVMSAFHENGGIPMTSHKKLLTDILKDEWGFEGFVVSDWDAVNQLVNEGVAVNKKEASMKAFNSGIDMDMLSSGFKEHLEQLINEDSVSRERINDAVRRILRIKYRLGLFEHPYMPVGKEDILCEEHRKLARKIAGESMVLLENKNSILPINKENVKKIAVIGPMCDEKDSMLGTWSMDGRAEDVISILEAVNEYEKEFVIKTAPMHLFDIALQIARESDIIVLALGESKNISGEARSVANTVLPVGQLELLKAIHNLRVPLITVISAGRPLVMTEVTEWSDALLYAWHGGVEHGHAVADILFGRINPSAKLPVTFLRNSGQIPCYYNHVSNGRKTDEYYENAQFRGYEDCLGKPLYPFGYGLSYSEFIYENLDVQVVGTEVKVSIEVKNIGEVDGSEIVQCYIRDIVATYSRPMRELKGFEKVRLKAGECKKVNFWLGKEELSYYTPNGELIFEKGEFAIYIGMNCVEGYSQTVIVNN